jgi:hypothetical protein
MKLLTLLLNPDDSAPSENCQDPPCSPSSTESNLQNARDTILEIVSMAVQIKLKKKKQ